MSAKQMGGYSDGCALSGNGRFVGSFQKKRLLLAWPEPKSVLPDRGRDLELLLKQPTLVQSLLSGGRQFDSLAAAKICLL